MAQDATLPRLAQRLTAAILAAPSSKDALTLCLRSLVLFSGARHAEGRLERAGEQSLHAAYRAKRQVAANAGAEENGQQFTLQHAGGLLHLALTGAPQLVPEARASALLAPLLPVLLCRAKADGAAAAGRLFSDIVQAAGDAILCVNEEGRIVLFNAQAERIFGYAAEDILSEPLETLLPRQMRGAHRQRVIDFSTGAAQAKTMGRRPEVFGQRRDGTLFPADISIAKTEGETGLLLTAIVRDLSQLRQTELALLARERELEEIIERMPFGIVIGEEETGRILLANGAFAQITGEPVEAMIGARASAFFTGLAAHSLAFDPLWSQSTFQGMEVEVNRRAGKPAKALVSTVRLTYQGKKAVLFGCNDLTAQLETLAKLRESQAKLKRAQFIARIGDWEWSLGSGKVSWSDEAYRILNRRPGAEQLQPEDFIRCVHPEDRPHVQSAFTDARQNLAPLSVQCRLAPPDEAAPPLKTGTASTRHIRLEGRLEKDGHGLPVKWVGTVQDVTEEAEINQELIEARNKALAASRTKTRFLANMSHELRTPLNAIIGFSEVIAHDLFHGDMTKYREYANDILQSGHHLLDLVNDVLDSSRVEVGQIKLKEEPIDLRALAEESVRMVRERADQKGLTIRLKTETDLPALYADHRLCRQILLNLLMNAIKFTPEQKEIGLDIVPLACGRLSLTVWDQGIGIDARDMARILQPFEQAETSLCRQNEGVGLGLSLCKSFAELHGAAFRIESAPNQGTRVFVTFPPERSSALTRAQATIGASEAAPLLSLTNA
ncbi:PAS domain S-box protein [Tepidicaulis sp.]|uniref:sensor histidine kinase n=1 Tax=Tepidicaulis sp. TaxID=1920809 RepID=UPI003B5D0034